MTHETRPEAVVIVVQPSPTTSVVILPQLPDQPTMLTCPSCHASVITTVERKPGLKTHLWAMLLCFFGCVLCCWVPYVMDDCQDALHYCPSCGSFLGVAR